MEKYQGRYRIPSARWATWDYGSNAAYFVTICTAQMTHDFGTIHDGVMAFSPLGKCAQDCWAAIPDHFPFVGLDGFVVMPNHVHGIVIIDKPAVGACGAVETQNLASDETETQNLASDETETQNLASLHPSKQNKFGPQSRNLASIVRGFKIGVTKFARQTKITFEWQERYYDHVIRNIGEHERIRDYVEHNPKNWADDRFQSPVMK